MNLPLVSVITSTTGNPLLDKCMRSVAKQTHSNIQHLVIADGIETHIKVTLIVADVRKDFPDAKIDVLYLPYATGKDRWNGHRNLAAGVYLSKGDYISFLDDDNTMDENHIESLFDVINKGNLWASSLRKIVDQKHNYICNDDCECLGPYQNIGNYHFVDMNCFLLPKKLAVEITPMMHRKFREPGEVPVDTAMTHYAERITRNEKKTWGCNGLYTLNYAVGGSPLSVKAEFFLEANPVVEKAYKEQLGLSFPWRKK